MLLNRESNLRQTFFRSLRANYSSVPKCTIDIPLCFDIQANHKEKFVMSTVNNTLARRRNSIQKHFQPQKIQEVGESWSYDLLHGKLFLFNELREGNTNTNLNFILPCCLLCPAGVPATDIHTIQFNCSQLVVIVFRKWNTTGGFDFSIFGLDGLLFGISAIYLEQKLFASFWFKQLET